MAASAGVMQKRIHPLFPTLAETRADPSVAYSDHLHIFGKVPLNKEGATLNISSWNTLFSNLPSGIHDKSGWETDEGAEQRYTRIVDGLIEAIAKHQIDCFLFQEAEVVFILPLLKAKLTEKGWAFHYNEAGLITGYNTGKLKPLQEGYEPRNRVLSNAFRHPETGRIIEIYNSWGRYDYFPHFREEQYRALLSPKEGDDGNVIRIVGCDSNNRIAPVYNNDEDYDGIMNILMEDTAPLDNIEQNIVTGAVPMGTLKGKYENPEQQIGDYSDGIFSCGVDGIIHQMKTHVLDFKSGDIVLPQTDKSELSYVDEFRMVMCLDDHYQKIPLIANQTVFQYEAYLQKQATDPNIRVRVAKNSMNGTAIGIRFSPASKLYDNVRASLEGIPGIQSGLIHSETEGKQYPTIFVPIAYAPQLKNAIDESLRYDREPLLQHIDTELTRLNKEKGFSLFKRDSSFKISCLQKLRDKIANADEFATGTHLVELYRAWQVEESTVTYGDIEIKRSHAALMALPRNRFKAFFGIEEETTSARFLKNTFRS